MYLGYFCLEQTFLLCFTFTFFEQKNFYFYFLTFSKQTKTSTFTFLLFSKLLKLYFYFFTFFQTNKLLLLLFYFIPRFWNPTFTYLLFYKSGCLTFSRKFNFFLTLLTWLWLKLGGFAHGSCAVPPGEWQLISLDAKQ